MGMAESVVRYDDRKERGVRNQVAGPYGMRGMGGEEIEEMVRRGGVFGVLGRL
jgi:hypothetical protein